MARLTINHIIVKPKEMLPNCPVMIFGGFILAFGVQMVQREGPEEESSGFTGHFRVVLGNVRCQKTDSLIFSLFLLLQGIHALEISLLCNKKCHRKLLKNTNEEDDCLLY